MFRTLSNTASLSVADISLHLRDIEITPISIAAGSPLAEKSLTELDLRKKTGLTVLAIRRGSQILTNLDAKTEIQPDDELFVIGSPRDGAIVSVNLIDQKRYSVRHINDLMVSETTDPQTLQLKVGQTLQDFWESYTGVRPGHVNVVVDRQAIVVLLEEVLAPAELQLAHTEAGRLTLQKYGERIIVQARPHLQQVVTKTVGQEVNLVEFHLDVVTGTILGFFRLK
jgi:uncharacterized protein YbcI